MKKTVACVVSLMMGGCTINQLPPPQPAPASTEAPAATTAPTAAASADAGAPATTSTATAATTPPAGASGQPAYQETPPPPPAEKPQMLKFKAAEGVPKGLKKGGDTEGFWVWHDDRGGKKWHVRSTAHAGLHRFHGGVSPESGQITSVKPTRLEYNDRVKSSDKGISFDFQTQSNEDGFDFETTGQCVRFYLHIDGKSSTTQQISVGKNDAHPPSPYFKLCP